MRFQDRREAGRRLARELQRFAGERPIVLALPRGGVPVGYEVARALHAPLDVLVARKLGAPFQPELGVGAVAEGGALFVDRSLCASIGVTPGQLEAIAARERVEIERRVRRYRGGRALIDLTGRTVILVDDGVATGGTAQAALRALHALAPARIVFAVPVASPEALPLLEAEADELVALLVPEDLTAVGNWYRDFTQISDDEVAAWLERAAEPADGEHARERAVAVQAGEVTLEGNLTLPDGAGGLVLFAHGSGSSRFSPRNRAVATVLHAAGLGTLLVDLLTADEERLDARTGELRFDIDLLSARMAQVTDWIARQPAIAALPLGYFGASTGAAAALVAAASRPEQVAAVVSRGGRPDLAARALPYVRAPTLLVVGGADREVLRLNRQALEELSCEKQLEIVPGAGHLFEEPGAHERVAELAAAWLRQHLIGRQEPATLQS